MSGGVFRVGLRDDQMPDVGLSLLIRDLADRRARARPGKDDAAGRFIRRLADAVARDADGKVAGQLDAWHLSAAEKREVGAVLVAGLEQARTDRHGSRAELGHLAAAWMEFTR